MTLQCLIIIKIMFFKILSLWSFIGAQQGNKDTNVFQLYLEVVNCANVNCFLAFSKLVDLHINKQSKLFMASEM